MESDARPPEKLSDKGSMTRNWKRFKQDFLIYMRLTGGMTKTEDEKAAWLKNLIGQVGLEALETISFDRPDEKENMTILIQKLEELFDPPKNEVEERYKFFSRSKKGSESIDAFIEDLKIMAKLCNFGDQTESLVRDAVILDIKDKNLRKIFFEEKDLNLEKIKIIYKTYESNNAKMKEASKKLIPEEATSLQRKSAEFAEKRERKNPCWRCGEKHPLKACPAFRNICCYCKNYNHFSHRCPVAKLDSVEITAAGTVPTKPNISSSPFGIDKDYKPDQGYKNNLNALQNNEKEKIILKHETLKSDPLVKNFEIVEPVNPKKVENQFSTRSNFGIYEKPICALRKPLSQTTTGMQPSAPPESLLDLNIQKPTTQFSTAKKVLPTNKNKILEPSETGQNASQSNFQGPRSQSSKFPPKCAPLLYPELPNSVRSVPQYSQNNFQSNAGGGIPKYAQRSSSANIRKELTNPKQKCETDCVVL